MPDLWRSGVRSEQVEDIGYSGTFEPWLGGDRQRGKRVAKPRDPLKKGSSEVSLS
jgi:hypothetical protein